MKRLFAKGILVAMPVGFFTAVVVVSGLKMFLLVLAFAVAIVALVGVAAWAIITLQT